MHPGPGVGEPQSASPVHAPYATDVGAQFRERPNIALAALPEITFSGIMGATADPMAPDSPSPNVSQILDAIAGGDRYATDQLLPLVYDELRRLARFRLKREQAGGGTLQATALVHEAYLRLVGAGSGTEGAWESRGHFFAAAARAMRHILVERARRRGRVRHGADRSREPLTDAVASLEPDGVDVVGLDAALTALEAHHERAGRIVMLRYFAGLSIEEVAAALGIGVTAVKAEWNYAKAWLHRKMSPELEP